MAVRTISLADSKGLVRLLNFVNSLERPVCQLWRDSGKPRVQYCHQCLHLYRERDSPQMQASWQDSAGVLHQALSAHRGEHFGQDYGVWLKQWRLLHGPSL